MQISVLTEHDQLETRVALSPDTVKKLVSNGLNIIIQSGCGQQSNYSDQQYEEAGAKVTRTISDKVLSSDILVTVKRPDDKILASGSNDKRIILWHQKEGKVERGKDFHAHDNGVSCLKFHP